MDSLIQISKLNDFLYSPKSLYFHSVYESFDTAIYHQKPQIVGNFNHQAVDQKKYSTSKNQLQGLTIYCQELGLIGEIDTYDSKTKTLIERKTLIKKIHSGYKAQLWAQYYCMLEMGFEVRELEFYSFSNNKKYQLNLPVKEDYNWLRRLIEKIQNYDLSNESLAWKDGDLDKVTIYKELYF